MNKARKEVKTAAVSKSNSVENEQKRERIYQCTHCSKSFPSSRAYGGHFSRVHGGQSNAYNRKMAVRDERAPQRAQSRIVKEMIKRIGRDPDNKKLTMINIVKLRDSVGKLRSDAVEKAARLSELSTEWFQELLAELQLRFPEHESVYQRMFKVD